jgi:uncharacterized membrane protein
MSTMGSEAPQEPGLMTAPKSRPAGDGTAWIGAGWRLFSRAALMWIVAMLVLLVILILANLIPLLGQIVMHLLNPVFTAGLMVACATLERGGEFELEHLFAGFKRNFGSLLVVGIIVFAVEAVLLLLFVGIAGVGLFSGIITAGSGEEAEAILLSSVMPLMLGTLIVLALAVPLLMAYWFAPALVVFHGMAPLAAMRASFIGCLRNIVPSLVYGVVMLALAIVAVIPLGLGLFVWVPLFFTSTYAAYRAMFTEPAGAAPA